MENLIPPPHRVSLYNSPVCSPTHFVDQVDQAGLELRDPPASSVIKGMDTVPGYRFLTK